MALQHSLNLRKPWISLEGIETLPLLEKLFKSTKFQTEKQENKLRKEFSCQSLLRRLVNRFSQS
jgi:hypothetical protein